MARTPSSLNHFEAKRFSQNGEDGILDELFARLGVGEGQFLEIGAHDGKENCTRHLLVDCGWRGVWVEGDPARTAAARAEFGDYPVTIHEEIVTRENVIAIAVRHGIEPGQLDLLVIDVDGNDYWLFERLVPALRPGVVVVEYNAWFGPRAWWVMRYDPAYTWDKTVRHGASIAPYCQLARRLGYRLVVGDLTGVNLFFVRDDLATAADRPLPSLSPAEAYHVPKYLVLGHSPAPPVGGPMEALSEEASRGVELKLDRLFTSEPVVPQEPIFLTVSIINRSAHDLRSKMPHPVTIAIHWLRGDQVVAEETRTPLTWPIRRSSRRVVPAQVVAPRSAGSYTLRLTLVQEGVRWHDEYSVRRNIELPVVVTDPEPSHSDREPSAST